MARKRRNSQELSPSWVFSPLVFLATSGLIVILITKGGSIDYPFLLMSGVCGAMYVWPQWRKWPNSFHNAFMITCVAAATLVVGYYVYSYTISLRRNKLHE